MTRRALLVALLVLTASAARATDYGHEIDLYIIEPCIKAVLRDKGGVRGLSEQEAVDLVKTLNESAWETIREATIPLVTGRSDATRTAAYDYARERCITVSLGR